LNMFTARRLPLTIAFALLVTLAFGAGCNGFFVDPQLTSITVGPSGQNVQLNQTLQMAATGTYDDGSTKNITGSVLWSSSDETVATIDKGGKLTAGSQSGTVTVTANSGTISGSQTVNIVLSGVSKITVAPKGPTGVAQGASLNFTATATVPGGTVDVTSSVSWTTSDTTNTSITNQTNPAVFTAGNGATHGETVTVTATYTVGTSTFTDTGTVNIQ
jgi:hypothetical protein